MPRSVKQQRRQQNRRTNRTPKSMDISPKRKRVSRRRAKGPNRAPRVNKLSNQLCGVFNPFCVHAEGSKVASVSTVNTISFLAQHTTAVITDAAGQLAYRASCGLDLQHTSAFTFTGPDITAITASNSPYQSTITQWASTYRVVSSAVHLQYIGAPLAAAGRFRICLVPTGTGLGSFDGEVFPISIGGRSGNYIDVSAYELLEGITVPLVAGSVEARQFEPDSSTTTIQHWQGVSVIGTGLPVSTSLLMATTCQYLELMPEINTAEAHISTTNPSPTSIYEQAVALMNNGLSFVMGSIEAFDAETARRAYEIARRLVSESGVETLYLQN